MLKCEAIFTDGKMSGPPPKIHESLFVSLSLLRVAHISIAICYLYKSFKVVWMATEAIEVAAATFLHNLCITCFPLIFGPPLYTP